MNMTATETETPAAAVALDPFKPTPGIEASAWRAEQARLLAAGEIERSHACGWVAWDLETRTAIRYPSDVRWGTGTGRPEITRYGERVVGPEAW